MEAQESRIRGRVLPGLPTVIVLGLGTILSGCYGCQQGHETAAIAKQDSFDNDTPRTTLQGHADTILAAAFSASGQKLTSVSKDGTVIVWDPVTRRQEAEAQVHSGDLVRAAFSPDDRTLALATKDGAVMLYDLTTRQVRGPLRGDKEKSVTSLAFSPDGKLLATGVWSSSVVLWEVSTAARRVAFRANYYGFAPLPDRPKSMILPGPEILAVCFSRDGKTLVTGSGQPKSDVGQVRFWEVASLTELNAARTKAGWDEGWVASKDPSLDPPPGFSTDFGWVRALAFSPDGTTLAAGGGYGPEPGGIKLWNVAKGKERGTLLGHAKRVTCVAFSPDGKILASGSDDQTIKLWDLTSQRERRTLQGHSGPITVVAFSPDGKTLASGSDGKTVRFWKIDKGE